MYNQYIKNKIVLAIPALTLIFLMSTQSANAYYIPTIYLQNTYNLHNYTIPDLGGYRQWGKPGPSQVGNLPTFATIGIVAAVGVLIIYLWILRRDR